MKRLLELLERVALAWAIVRHGGPKPQARPANPAEPPVRAPPREAPGLPPYREVTVKALDHVRGIASREDWQHVRICRGPAKGCQRHLAMPEDCSSCYVVPWHEKRSSAELLAAMERGDA